MPLHEGRQESHGHAANLSDVRRLTPVLLLLASLAVTPVRAGSHYTRHDAMVPMSDEVVLEASVYVPNAPAPDGGFPLVVRQHGGGSNKDNPYDTKYGLRFVESTDPVTGEVGPGNFALLMYSHRGHGRSGGIFDFFAERTTRDFSEMLDWVSANPSLQTIDTNNVGVSGYSQGGGESLIPAAHDDRVKAVAVGNTFADLNHALNPNDCFKFSFATGIFLFAYKLSASRTDDASAARWGAQLYTDTEDVGAGPVPSTAEDFASRSPARPDRIQALAERKVPVFWAQSWEDQLFPGDHPEVVLRPLERDGVPVHYWFSSGGHAAGPDFPADLEAKEQAMRDWFDEFLRGASHGFASGTRPKVDYWQRTPAGAPGPWIHKTAAAWPIPGATGRVVFPHLDGTLGDARDGAEAVGTVVNDLASANVANEAIANEIARQVPGMGPVVRSVPEGNPLDTVAYSTPPLPASLEVTGAPVVEAALATSASRVVQLNAKVWDVAPDGPGTLVNRGCASVENGGPVPTVRLALWPNSHVFPERHRLMLTLAAVDFPTFKPDTEPSVTRILSATKLVLPTL